MLINHMMLFEVFLITVVLSDFIPLCPGLTTSWRGVRSLYEDSVSIAIPDHVPHLLRQIDQHRY